jgi:hypothetical protein
MPFLGARIAALVVDLCIANVIGVILAVPFFFIAENPIKVLIPTTPFMICFAMLAMSFVLEANTPGKRLMQVQVVGNGCLICREIQRLGWYIILTAAPIVSLIVPIPWQVIVGAVVIWVAVAFGYPLFRGDAEFPHNRLTGFQITHDKGD